MEEKKEGQNAAEALATALYNAYGEGGLIADPVFWEHYGQLRKAVEGLCPEIREQILCAAEALAAYQEQRAFRAGLEMRNQVPE